MITEHLEMVEGHSALGCEWSVCHTVHAATGYLRLLLRDEDEPVVVDEVAVDVLSKGMKGPTVNANGPEHDGKTGKSGTFLTWLSQLMLHFPSRAVHCIQSTQRLGSHTTGNFIVVSIEQLLV